MSLDKAIEHKKEHRKQYEDARYYVHSYRNGQANSMAKNSSDRRDKRKRGYYSE